MNRVQVRIAGEHWAAQGVAQALLRADSQGLLAVETLAPADAARTQADVLVLVQPDAALARAVSRDAPASLPVLWLGVQGPDVRTAGINGLLSAQARDTQLSAAVHALAAGLHVADGPLPVRTTTAEEADPLTPRELEVFELMAKGLANRDIALALAISSHTAKFHVAQILEKSGSATRTEAVRQGLRRGWIGL